jgi:hypothetical protein
VFWPGRTPGFQGQGLTVVKPDVPLLGVVPHASVFRPSRHEGFVQVVSPEPRPCAPQRPRPQLRFIAARSRRRLTPSRLGAELCSPCCRLCEPAFEPFLFSLSGGSRTWWKPGQAHRSARAELQPVPPRHAQGGRQRKGACRLWCLFLNTYARNMGIHPSLALTRASPRFPLCFAMPSPSGSHAGAGARRAPKRRVASILIV